MTVLCSLELLTAGQQMNVAVCNVGDVRDSVINEAKAETEVVYRLAGVQIVDAFPPPAGQTHDPWFVIRLRTDKPQRMVGSSSLNVMGKPFVVDAGGYMADAYLQAIQATSELRHTNPGVLLGFVMAHELGHLLVGAEHNPMG